MTSDNGIDACHLQNTVANKQQQYLDRSCFFLMINLGYITFQQLPENTYRQINNVRIKKTYN